MLVRQIPDSELHFLAGVIIPKFVFDAGIDEVYKYVLSTMTGVLQSPGVKSLYERDYLVDGSKAFSIAVNSKTGDCSSMEGVVKAVAEHFRLPAALCGHDAKGVYVIRKAESVDFTMGGLWKGVFNYLPTAKAYYDGDCVKIDDYVYDLSTSSNVASSLIPCVLVTPDKEILVEGDKGWIGHNPSPVFSLTNAASFSALTTLKKYLGHYMVAVHLCMETL